MRLKGKRVSDGLRLDRTPKGDKNIKRLGHDFPECCLIYHEVWSGGGRIVAGTGVLINPRTVLTAAHVVFKKKHVSVTFDPNPGTTNEIYVDGVKIHKEYALSEKDYDLAILSFSSDIKVLKTPFATVDDFINEPVLTIVGYGDLNHNGVGVGPAKNYAGDIVMISNSDWHDHSRDHFFGHNPSIEFVVGPKPCEFDSGAPLFNHERSGRKLMGLMSRKVEISRYGTHDVDNCKRDTICTRLDNFNDKNYVNQ